MRTITVEFPESAVPHFAATPEAFARELRLAAAIEWYREGRVSQGKGAEIAGVSRVAFLDALFEAKVPACQVTVEELREEVENVLQARRERLAADPAGQDRPS